MAEFRIGFEVRKSVFFIKFFICVHQQEYYINQKTKTWDNKRNEEQWVYECLICVKELGVVYGPHYKTTENCQVVGQNRQVY